VQPRPARSWYDRFEKAGQLLSLQNGDIEAIALDANSRAAMRAPVQDFAQVEG